MNREPLKEIGNVGNTANDRQQENLHDRIDRMIKGREVSATDKAEYSIQKCFEPMERNAGIFETVDSLLKHPGRVVYEIDQGRLIRVALSLGTVTVVAMLMYGLVIGMFSRDQQLWYVPIKAVAGVLLSAAICLPSLYILTALSGGRQSFGQVCALCFMALSLIAVLMVGFAPVAWIFSQSTNAAGFMGCLHLVFWLTGTCFALRLLKASLQFLNSTELDALKLWSIIFTVVVFQMCTFLRPLVGEFSGYGLQEKMFFLRHWADCL